MRDDVESEDDLEEDELEDFSEFSSANTLKRFCTLDGGRTKVF